MSDTDTDAIDTTIIMWRDRGVGPGGIANALEAMGLGKWTAKAVGDALKRLGIKADTLRAAEAVFTPGEEGTADDYEGVEGWAGHCGGKFTRPWLDNTGRDVRDTGAAGEQGDGGEQARPAPSQIAPWSTWSGARRPNRTTLMDQRVRVTRLP